MVNKAKPEVKIMLDRERTLKFNFNALVYFEEATGKNYLQMNQNNLSVSDFRALMYGCLKSDDPELTLEQTGEIMSLISMDELAEKLREVQSIAMGTKKEGSSPLGKKGKAGTG